MQTQAPARIGMPLDEFLAQSSAQPFELIDGERLDKMPTVFGPSEIVQRLFLALYLFAVQRQLGHAFSETTFVLPDTDSANWVRGTRIPDVMYYVGTRIEAYKREVADYELRPLALVPDLVIEVVSPTDTYSAVSAKVDVYLRDGVRLIWIVDPQRRKAAVHAPGQPMQQLDEGAALSGGEIVPGFALPLADLFKQA